MNKQELIEIHSRLSKIHVLGEEVENFYIALFKLTQIINSMPEQEEPKEENHDE